MSAGSSSLHGLNSLIDSGSIHWQLREQEQSNSHISRNENELFSKENSIYNGNFSENLGVQPNPQTISHESVNEEYTELPYDAHLPSEQKVPDRKWGLTFGFLTLALFTYSFLMVWRTNPNIPPATSPYAAIQKAFPLFHKDAIICMMLSVIWLFCLVAIPRFLYFLLASVPLTMFAFAVYLLKASRIHLETSIQPKLMLLTGIILLVAPILLSYYVWRRRIHFETSFNIIRLACRVIADIPQITLIFISFLFSFYVLIFIWVRLFARLFLRGSTLVGSVWVLPRSSWVLASFYSLHFLWLCTFFHALQWYVITLLWPDFLLTQL